MVWGVSSIKGLRRLGGISRVLIKHGFGDMLDRLFTRKRVDADEGRAPAALRMGMPAPGRVRRAFEELGPSFIKLGHS